MKLFILMVLVLKVLNVWCAAEIDECSTDPVTHTTKPTTTKLPTTTPKLTTTTNLSEECSSDETTRTTIPTTTKLPTTTPTTELSEECSSDETTHTTIPTTTKLSSTTSKPTTTIKPTTTAKPTTTVKPTTTIKPTTTNKPTTTIKPTTTAKPTTTSRPTTTRKPTTTAKPTTTLKPSTTPHTTPKRTTILSTTTLHCKSNEIIINSTCGTVELIIQSGETTFKIKVDDATNIAISTTDKGTCQTSKIPNGESNIVCHSLNTTTPNTCGLNCDPFVSVSVSNGTPTGVLISSNDTESTLVNINPTTPLASYIFSSYFLA